MKKERNAFFQNNSASSYFYPNMQQLPVSAPYPMATESNSSFYQGPIINPLYTQSADINSELESKVAKLERQINRLDARISKLESETNISTTNEYNSNNNTMYML